MAGQPYDYRLQYADPTQALMQGIQGGQTLRANEMTFQAAQEKAAAEKLAAQQKAQREQQRQDLVAKYFSTGDASMLPNIIMQYPEMRESIDTMVKVKGEAYKQDQTSFFARVVPALKSGRGDVALDVIKTRVSALEQSGSDPQQLEMLKTAQKALESGDQNAIRQIAALAELSLAAYDDKYAPSMKALGEYMRTEKMLPPELQKAQAEALIAQSNAQYANANNQATLQAKLAGVEVALRNATTAEERVRLEREKAAVEIQMKRAEGFKPTAAMQTLQSEAVNQAVKLRSTADSSRALADNLRRFSTEGRGFNNIGEWFKTQFGAEDEYTALRQQYLSLKNTMVGAQAADFKPLSNADLEMLQKGFPDESASPEFIANFLEKTAKFSEIQAMREEAKAEWIGQVGNMGSAKQDIEINGMVIPKGTSYSKFIRALVGSAASGKPTKSLDDIWK